jgi:hypothetical protein
MPGEQKDSTAPDAANRSDQNNTSQSVNGVTVSGNTPAAGRAPSSPSPDERNVTYISRYLPEMTAEDREKMGWGSSNETRSN